MHKSPSGLAPGGDLHHIPPRQRFILCQVGHVHNMFREDGEAMQNTYEKIRISYKQHGDTGLLCAFSDDLKGLIVFGRTPSQLYEKIPVVCADLVQAITGEAHAYRWAGDESERASGFAVPKSDLGDLIPA